MEPTCSVDPSTGGFKLHTDESSVRNVCFLWPDGRKAFFNYAYLVSVDLVIADAVNLLSLHFGSYTVILKGHNLGRLFDLLLNHKPKTVTVVHIRYITDTTTLKTIVIDIVVKGE